MDRLERLDRLDRLSIRTFGLMRSICNSINNSTMNWIEGNDWIGLIDGIKIN